ncbi:MAG: AMP-binding protein [Lysobacterales bacterium]
MSLLDHLRGYARQRPQALALQDAQGALTRGGLWSAVQRLAGQLLATGITRYSSQLDNGIDAVVLDLALRTIGAVHLPLPGFFTPAQRLHAQRDAGIEAHITLGGGAIALSERWTLDRLEAAPVLLPAATALITYTSGSTGQPKGVCLSAEHLDRVAMSIVDALAGQTPQRHLCLLPLSILLEQVAGVYAALLADAPVLLPPLAATGLRGAAQLDAVQLAACIDQQRPESVILVPQMLQAWLAAAAAGARVPDSLRLIAVGGARVAPSLLDAAARHGLPVCEGYGLSELGSVVCLNRPGRTRPGSVGPALPHARVSVAADGELLIDAPQFLGYVGAARPPAGPYASGDLGSIDDDGYVRIAGRKRNVFITAFGRNVSPEWVESELTQHPLIAQAVVQGEARERNCAVLVLRRAVEPAVLRSALDSVNAGLPDYAQVHHYVLASEAFTPANDLLTSNGRVRRERVLARYADQIDTQYQAIA